MGATVVGLMLVFRILIPIAILLLMGSLVEKQVEH